MFKNVRDLIALKAGRKCRYCDQADDALAVTPWPTEYVPGEDWAASSLRRMRNRELAAAKHAPLPVEVVDMHDPELEWVWTRTCAVHRAQVAQLCHVDALYTKSLVDDALADQKVPNPYRWPDEAN